ncbi:MAG: hypothetical protein AAFS10_14220, partial [Myxococcota bacterium]
MTHTSVSELLEGELEELLIAGSDVRVEVRPTGLNKYGCAPHPRDAFPLGSCTSSSPTPMAMRAVSEARGVLREAHARGRLVEFAHQTLERLRIELASLLRLDQVPGARIVFTPSGTDAELWASVLALGDGDTLRNIIVGPLEVGSGTELAAQGRHFSTTTPSGFPCEKGVSVDEGLSARIVTKTILLRDVQGEMRTPEELNAEAVTLVEEAIEAHERVLLHIVAHSKTGVHAPSLETVHKLVERFGDTVSVLVDAAQGRFSRRGLVEILDRGYMVLITGSKFYGGPPFSGALVVSPSMEPRIRAARLPPGAKTYFTAGELPSDGAWVRLRGQLDDAPNLGLLARWTAAIAEIRAYYQADERARYRILRAFEVMVPELLASSPHITLHAVAPKAFESDRLRLLESKTTVYPFILVKEG